MGPAPPSSSKSQRVAFGALTCAAAASLWLLGELSSWMSSAGFFEPSVPGRFSVLLALLLVLSVLQVFFFAWAFRCVAKAPGQGRRIILPTGLALASLGFELLLIPFIFTVALVRVNCTHTDTKGKIWAGY